MNMKKTYEAMFLLDAGNPDFEAAAAPVREVLARTEAEVLSLKPWDERRLAYEIRGRKRGLYVLTYFRAAPSRISELLHEIYLNEKILRALVLSADHVRPEQIQAETPATAMAARRAAGESARAEHAEAQAGRPAGAETPPEPAGPEHRADAGPRPVPVEPDKPEPDKPEPDKPEPAPGDSAEPKT